MGCLVRHNVGTDIKSIIAEVSDYIGRRIGLKAQALSETGWTRALRKRIAATHCDLPGDYLNLLLKSRSEYQELIELLVVSETWFFRDRAALDFLIAHVRTDETKRRLRPWRVLSMACATGEEAYSMAMAILEAGVPPNRCLVEGVDISENALEIARKATYGPNSFRSRRTLMHKRFFDKVDEGLAVQPQVQQCVKFFRDNVVSAQSRLTNRKYDIVFCRNLLIYLSPQAQLQVFNLCESILEEGGIVIFGPTESELARLAGFVPTGPRQACAFFKRSKKTIPVAPFWRHAVAGKRFTPHTETVTSGVDDVTETEESVKARSEGRANAMLRAAMTHADNGEIHQAIQICRSYVASYGPSVEAYYLLGMLCMASHDERSATNYFEKVVYLEPTHYEALVNLALIAERSGNRQLSELYWKRARRHHEQKTTEGTLVTDRQSDFY